MELISVIIPVYNTAEFLPRCLDSVLGNSYRNLEVICINDGSTDESGRILSEYEKKDSRVVVINQENAGVSAARNAGLDRAGGEFIAFVDSDDWIHPQYFEILVGGILTNNADVAVCRAIETDRLLEYPCISGVSFRQITFSQVAADENVKAHVWGRLYRYELIRNQWFNQEMKLAEDAVFNLKAIYSKENSSVVVCDKQLYYYYIRWDSAAHNLRGIELKPVISWFLDHADGATTEIAEIYTCEALKRIFAWRYYAMMANSKEELRQIKYLQETALKSLRHITTLSFGKKCIYRLFSAVPLCYRLFRILKDPTLLNWEKRMIADRRNRK